MEIVPFNGCYLEDLRLIDSGINYADLPNLKVAKMRFAVGFFSYIFVGASAVEIIYFRVREDMEGLGVDNMMIEYILRLDYTIKWPIPEASPIVFCQLLANYGFRSSYSAGKYLFLRPK